MLRGVWQRFSELKRREPAASPPPEPGAFEANSPGSLAPPQPSKIHKPPASAPIAAVVVGGAALPKRWLAALALLSPALLACAIICLVPPRTSVSAPSPALEASLGLGPRISAPRLSPNYSSEQPPGNSLRLAPELYEALEKQAKPAPEEPTPLGYPAAFIIPDGFKADQLRVFAAPGDFALSNQSVTLVVRKTDGWLVDFWRNQPAESSSPQLNSATHIDGLWQLHQVVHAGQLQANITTQHIRLTEDAIETTAQLSLGAGKIRVITSYRLDADNPRAIITSRFEHESGGRLSHLTVGDAIKWGNTEYFVDGKRQRPTFSGNAKWIGRQGASGDLRLTTLEEKKMQVGFRSYHNGLSGEIRTQYQSVNLSSGEKVLIQRALEYAQIPIEKKEAAQGRLRVTLTDEAGAELAAKLSIQGVGITPTPSFGNTGGLEGAGRFVWSGVGRFDRSLAPGEYSVWATAGFERDAKNWRVSIKANEITELSAELPRVVQTPGWLSADLHLHQAPSPDSDIDLKTRVVSIAAEGVELAVPADHYTVGNFQPAIDELTRTRQLATQVLNLSGSEVSTVGYLFGHFNLFPMQLGEHVNYTNTRPKQLFAEMREVSPNGLIQVNHPRIDGLGYFARYRLDPTTMRVPAEYQAEYSDDFDLIEVFNGLEMMSEPKLRLGLSDWMRLLGRGYRYTATGNSDSHNLFYLDPGLPRNYIRIANSKSDADDLKASQSQVIAALKAGHVMVSSGPFLEVSVGERGPGETVSAVNKRIPLHIRVSAAPWVDVDSVEILLGAEGRRVRWIPVSEKKQIVRFDQTISLEVPERGFVVVLAKGSKPHPHTYTPGIKPIAFTNPIWIEPAAKPN